MANALPICRTKIWPTAQDNKIARTIAIGTMTSISVVRVCESSPAACAAKPNQPACPKDSRPVLPVSISKLTATMAAIAAWDARTSMNGES